MNRFLKKDFRVMLMGLLLLASCQAYSNSEDQTIEMEDLYKDLPFSMPKVERPVFPDYQVSIFIMYQNLLKYTIYFQRERIALFPKEPY